MNFRITLLAATAALALTAAPAVFAHDTIVAPAVEPAAGDVSGTYSWTMGGGGGGGGQETTLVLKQDGNKLTGTISGRGGETPIEDGTVENGTIKFKVTREYNGNKFVTDYSGTVSGESLKLSITSTREVEAKKKTV